MIHQLKLNKIKYSSLGLPCIYNMFNSIIRYNCMNIYEDQKMYIPSFTLNHEMHIILLINNDTLICSNTIPGQLLRIKHPDKKSLEIQLNLNVYFKVLNIYSNIIEYDHFANNETDENSLKGMLINNISFGLKYLYLELFKWIHN